MRIEFSASAREAREQGDELALAADAGLGEHAAELDPGGVFGDADGSGMSGFTGGMAERAGAIVATRL